MKTIKTELSANSKQCLNVPKRRRRSKLVVAVMSLLLFAVWTIPSAVQAQTTTATVFGTVTDASGAALPNATVTATDVANNFTRTATSDESGNFTISQLPIGTYNITAEISGFKKALKSGITLQIEQRINADFQLEAGNIAETVTVSAGNEQITDAYTSDRGQVIENRQIVELPLNGREYTQLLRLTPGAVDYRTNSISTTPDSSRPRITFGNISSVYNRYLLDGASNTDIHDSQAAISPSIEAIQEFSVKGNHYNAEYGGGGGVINVTIKSGGNDFHGALFEFLRNDKFDARPFFSPTRSPFRFNQFGGVVSGPVYLPRFGEGGPAFYKGRDRTFFLFNYEGLRARNPSDRFLRVPTLAERNGDFSALTYQLYDPFNTDAAGRRLPFAGNIIPRSRWNQFAAPILDYYPLPNQPLNSNNQNYYVAARNQTDADQITFRVDHRFSDKLTTFGRYSQTRRDDLTGESFPGAGGNLATTDGKQAVFGLTWVITPNVISETRFGVSQFTFVPEQNTRLDTNFDQLLGFSYASQINPVEFGFPTIAATGFTSLGTPRFRNFGPNRGYNINQSITYTRGNHTFKFGGNHERNRAETSFFVARTFAFNGSFTSLVTGTTFATPGSSFADFLLGTPLSITYGPTLPGVGRTSNIILTSDYSFYAQDDWRVNKWLTVNYGLRYDLNLPPIEANNRTLIGAITADGRVNYPAGLQIDDRLLPTQFPTPFTVDGRVVPAGQYFNRVDRRRIWDLDANNIQPRIGAAILPFGDEKTVIRVSYGIFNARNSGKLGFTAGLGAPFFIQQIDTQNQTGRPGNLRLGELPAASFTTAGIFQYNVIPLDNPDPFIQSWTGSIQRELPGKILLELSYLGNRATEVSSTLQLNVRRVPGADNGIGCPAPCSTPRPFPRTYPQFAEERTRGAFGESDFHAGVVKLERRFSNGLAFLSSFTWSKGMDNGIFVVGDDINGAQGTSVANNNVFNLAAERGRSAYNAERRFTANFVYELPFGSGQRFLSKSNRFVKSLISGWQLTGLMTFQSGFYFSVISPTDISGDGQVNDRVNRIADGNLPRNERSLQRWFDTGAFVAQPLNTFGNSGRTILEGPGLSVVDFGIFRQFRITENQRFQFRAEFFNAFNHANFALPNRVIDQPTFGVITATSTPPRNIQFALKYLF